MPMNEQQIPSNFTVYESCEELSTEDRQLLEQAIEARNRAYAPYSKFQVGAAILLDNGLIFQGNNQENAAYPSGMCAERVAIWSAVSMHPDSKITKVFITACSKLKKVDRPVSPCGSCRQAIAEYEVRQGNRIEIFFTGETGRIIKAHSIRDLLPYLFEHILLQK